jgi:hypothetical protein
MGLTVWPTAPPAYSRNMLHGQIRDAVRERLVDIHGLPPTTILRDELGLCLGATRVDVAAINGHLTGCEIKGSRDRLSRLPHQVGLYGQVLDVAVIVAEAKYAATAAQHVPEWWGIWQAEEHADRAALTELRPAGQNPSPDPVAVAQLLWRDEAYAELLARDATAGLARATRWRLWETLAALLPVAELGQVVRERLKARQDW